VSAGNKSALRVEPVTLSGRHARLEPLGPDHLDPLWAVADHPSIWAHQRSAINTEAKYLQLCHCFDVLGCIRVELKNDSLNARSRAAIERIGGIEEGTFRNHMIMPDGRIRHSVYFSMTSDRWPQVERQLESRLTPG